MVEQCSETIQSRQLIRDMALPSVIARCAHLCIKKRNKTVARTGKANWDSHQIKLFKDPYHTDPFCKKHSDFPNATDLKHPEPMSEAPRPAYKYLLRCHCRQYTPGACAIFYVYTCSNPRSYFWIYLIVRRSRKAFLPHVWLH